MTTFSYRPAGTMMIDLFGCFGAGGAMSATKQSGTGANRASAKQRACAAWCPPNEELTPLSTLS
jgi:hypothetical protein